MHLRRLFATLLLAGPAAADGVDDIMQAAQTAFAQMPTLQITPQIAGNCGADALVNQDVAYCTSRNIVFLSEEASTRPEAAYLVAHVLGHAVQVKHGVADVALREIRRRRQEEPKLRGFVARQVDCIAGFLFHRAGLPTASLGDWFEGEPFAGTHWGRDPLRAGPKVAIGLSERDRWFQRGQIGDLSNCGAGEFGPDLLLQALRG